MELCHTPRVKVSGGTGAEVFCRELDIELHIRVKADYSVFQTENIAIVKAVEAIAGGPASDSESYRIFVDSQTALRPIASLV